MLYYSPAQVGMAGSQHWGQDVMIMIARLNNTLVVSTFSHYLGGATVTPRFEDMGYINRSVIQIADDQREFVDTGIVGYGLYIYAGD